MPSMANDLNTVTLSGTLASDAERYEKEDLVVTRMRVDVDGAGEKDDTATFKVVAFGATAEAARDFKAGDRVVLSGPLKQRRDSREPAEIQARVLIRMRPELLEHAARE
jgi:single-stranded DNA-binding protein